MNTFPIFARNAIPKGQTVVISVNGTTMPEEFYISEDVTLNVSSTFDNLISGGGGNVFASALSSAFSAGSSLGLSGQFAQQSFQVWKSTNPMELSFNLEVNMKTSGKIDVFDPIIKVMKLCVPSKGDIGLIPPGPSVITALKDLADELKSDDSSSAIQDFTESDQFSAGTEISISVGSYLNLSKVIVTKAVPIFSHSLDSEGYPIWGKLQVDIRTANVVTTDMLDNLNNGVT